MRRHSQSPTPDLKALLPSSAFKVSKGLQSSRTAFTYHFSPADPDKGIYLTFFPWSRSQTRSITSSLLTLLKMNHKCFQMRRTPDCCQGHFLSSEDCLQQPPSLPESTPMSLSDKTPRTSSSEGTRQPPLAVIPSQVECMRVFYNKI